VSGTAECVYNMKHKPTWSEYWVAEIWATENTMRQNTIALNLCKICVSLVMIVAKLTSRECLTNWEL